MKRSAGWFLMLVCTGVLTGCVERRYVITSDPPGAIVYENGKPIGPTPADGSFVYYGDYQFTLVHPNFETLQVTQCIPSPWYERFPLDFFAENIVPCRIKDVHRFHYQMQPRLEPNSVEILNRAQELRERGETIGPPPGSGKQPPPAAPPPLPPPVPPDATPPGQPILP